MGDGSCTQEKRLQKSGSSPSSDTNNHQGHYGLKPDAKRGDSKCRDINDVLCRHKAVRSGPTNQGSLSPTQAFDKGGRDGWRRVSSDQHKSRKEPSAPRPVAPGNGLQGRPSRRVPDTSHARSTGNHTHGHTIPTNACVQRNDRPYPCHISEGPVEGRYPLNRRKNGTVHSAWPT